MQFIFENDNGKLYSVTIDKKNARAVCEQIGTARRPWSLRQTGQARTTLNVASAALTTFPRTASYYSRAAIYGPTTNQTLQALLPA